jgi:hypothetical protein
MLCVLHFCSVAWPAIYNAVALDLAGSGLSKQARCTSSLAGMDLSNADGDFDWQVQLQEDEQELRMQAGWDSPPVDHSAEPRGPAALRPLPSNIKAAIADLLRDRDLTCTTIGGLRAELEAKFQLSPGGLDAQKDEVASLIQTVVGTMTSKMSQPHAVEEDLGEEDKKACRQTYLITFSNTVAAQAADGQALRRPKEFCREEIADAVATSLVESQVQNSKQAGPVCMAVFLEKHLDGEMHFHVALKLSHGLRFLGVKRVLLSRFGLASHWSSNGSGYNAAVAYGYVPSPHKPLAELDPTPFLWAASGDHPPLSEASRASLSAAGMAVRRETSRRAAAEKGKEEPRFQEVDIWPVVVQQNILPDGKGRESLASYAKRCGGSAMIKFCWNNWPRLNELIARAWQFECVEEYVELHNKTRIQILTEAASSPCSCQGKWLSAAAGLLARNEIPRADWCKAVYQSLAQGRTKGNLVCHAGLEGDEGKSFLLQPLLSVFGTDGAAC